MSRLNLPQRVVIVIALGVVIMLFGDWVTTIGGLGPGSYGWVAYAPLSRTTGPLIGGGLHYGWRLAIWAALTVLWAGGSLRMLRSPRGE